MFTCRFSNHLDSEAFTEADNRIRSFISLQHAINKCIYCITLHFFVVITLVFNKAQ